MAVITGNGFNNTLTGFATDDTISGLAGDDVLYGAGGEDVLYGGRMRMRSTVAQAMIFFMATPETTASFKTMTGLTIRYMVAPDPMS